MTLSAELLGLKLGGRLEQWCVGTAFLGSSLLWAHLLGQASQEEMPNRHVDAKAALKLSGFDRG